MEINIENKLFYDGKNDGRIRRRLLEMKELGLEQVGHGHFGVPNIMGGLYIEKVWGYDDIQFDEYLEFVKELISEEIAYKKLNELNPNEIELLKKATKHKCKHI